jgi:hypothetical protein
MVTILKKRNVYSVRYSYEFLPPLSQLNALKSKM